MATANKEFKPRSSIFDFGEPYDNSGVGTGAYLLVDGRNRRLYLSSKTAKILGHDDGYPFSLYVQFKNGNIGLSPHSWLGKSPLRFDSRRYASARGFVNDMQVPAGRYVYYGFENQWHAFLPEATVNPNA